MTVMIGKNISHYKILSKLGEGGMGVVYKAEDLRLHRFVALKFLHPDLTRDDDARARFVHEAESAAALNHAHICTIHEIDEHEGRSFIAMEFIEGGVLKDRIGKGPLPIDDLLEITMQVGEGLQKAHEKGIVHRDIKPANIMLTADGAVKILDFGLAKLKGASVLTRTHSTLGTLSYMSPEQARGEESDRRSDIFSLGVVLYEMITGHRPFKGEHPAAVLYSLMNDTPEPLARYKTDVPDEFQRVLDKALARDPGERYQHVDEMIADLRHLQHRLSGIHTVMRTRSRIPWIVAAAVLLVALAGMYLFSPTSPPAPRGGKSIAVLPFKNMSDSKEDEFFSDGLTEDIITQLSKISGIEKVIARTSVMRYKHTEKGIRDIGRELDVATILEGSVRRAGNQIRVVAQLIDVRTEGHLWADTYDKEMTQVFAIQSDVARQIAGALEATMSPAVRSRIDRKQTENAEAYQFYLKGRFSWNKRTVPDMLKSIAFFSRAIEQDSTFALAYAGLAGSHVILPGFGRSPQEHHRRAHQAATRALELDSTLAEARTVLASILESRYEWVNAEREYRRSIEFNPGYPTAHQWYSGLLVTLCRFDDAIREARRAVELDPLSLIINYTLARSLLYVRRYDQAIRQCDKGIELDPSFPWSYQLRGTIAEVQGRFDEAIQDYQKANLLSPDDPTLLGELGRVYARAGMHNEAAQALHALSEYGKQGYLLNFYMANVYYGLGDRDRTFEWLERSIRDHDASVMDMNNNPLWDDLRSDPRFIALLKEVGLRK